MKRTELALRGAIKMFSGLIAMGLLLFGVAGTFRFAGARRMLVLLFSSMLLLGTVLLIKAPKLLEKRLQSHETEPQQKKVILFSSLMFISCFVLSALDFRLGWTCVPKCIVNAACVVFVLTYAVFAELLRENAYLSRTVELQQEQHVVSTGLYGIVRHPMYAVILLMFFSVPLIIGSLAGLLPLFFLPAILVLRIRNEEKLLEEGLEGYRAYMQKVRFRLIPFIW